MQTQLISLILSNIFSLASPQPILPLHMYPHGNCVPVTDCAIGLPSFLLSGSQVLSPTVSGPLLLFLGITDTYSRPWFQVLPTWTTSLYSRASKVVTQYHVDVANTVQGSSSKSIKIDAKSRSEGKEKRFISSSRDSTRFAMTLL